MKKQILAAALAATLPALLLSQSVTAITLPATGLVPVVDNSFIRDSFTLVVSDSVVVNYLNGPRSVAVDAYHPSGTLAEGSPGGRTAANGVTVQAFGGTSDGGTIGSCLTALRVTTPETVDGNGVGQNDAVIGGCQPTP